MPFTPKKLALLMSSLYVLCPVASAQVVEPPQRADKEQAVKDSKIELPVVVGVGKVDKDADGHKKVYDANVTTLYMGREDLGRVQATNAADVLKGMNGVYSMDARNGTSITPNVRGLSGEGRVPLTVDGTEQSTNVWLQVYGAGNRNYVDPAMFRSIMVEKGPSLSAGVKSGVGGAINVRTLEAADIIPAGERLGIEFRAGLAGNSIKPQADANAYFGQDYRSIPGAVLGMDNNVNIPQPVPRTKGGGDILGLADHSEMISVAARNQLTDLLFSYSQRSKGNYFAGRRGTEDYTHNDAFAKDTAAYYPNLTKLYHAGNEVLSSSSSSKTWLLKNNWQLPHENKLGWSVMRSDLGFAETSPGQAVVMLGMAEALAAQGSNEQLVGEFPRSDLRLDTYRITHEWKPKGSRWIDLQSNLWMTKTDGVRHQSGGGVYYIKKSPELDAYSRHLADWNACIKGPDWANGLPSGAPAFSCYTDEKLNPHLGATQPVEPAHDGRIFAGSSQWTRHDRKGFDFRNLMRLSERLQLTVGGAFQRERLDERVADVQLSGGMGPGGAMFHYGTTHYGPRSGTRSESSGMFNFEWAPKSWLALSAGARYNRYSAFDEGLAERRRNKVASAQALKRKVGVTLEYGTLWSEEEMNALRKHVELSKEAQNKLTPEDYRAWHEDGITTPNMAAYEEIAAAWRKWLAGREGFLGRTGAHYWKNTAFVPMANGKLVASQSPFAGDAIDLKQTVRNAQGLEGEFGVTVPNELATTSRGKAVYEEVAEDQAWAAPRKQSGHAWSPVISATASLTPHGKVFMRHAQMTRFPSIFEVASTSVGLDGVGALSVAGASKPERSINWELGYAHDLTQFFPGIALADVRLSYYNTVIKDFIERDGTLSVIQFDEKKVSGIELQSNLDSGGFFGSLGATYRLKQELCDADYAYGMDVYYKRMPTCMSGGFADMLTATSLQPRYSINTELGARVFNDRLVFGLRSVYHAKAENPQLNALLNTYGKELWTENSMRQMYWHSVLLHDFFLQLDVHKRLDLNLKLSNLADRYYLDPMSKIPVPGPGRTLSIGLNLRY
ncbi:hemoglobin/transferrin/lactoferrin receptor protein [Paucibacter oligotrophus]|uniref:Hemoglobin/transferrin/lactoferrin receptor protein n=1 Tax=Roseateles oligotrophus TaxID=1769250 RepID=A0A840LE81_9BURK|nr:TonB-dependent receptor [Roseateles oligotrophus]MBB4845285.1 hemoglobin/transferrin/lactoferrin receptor protein [Roseateles oligotrophus]